MKKIKLKAINKDDLENKIKKMLNLDSDETYSIRELKKPFNLFFIHLKGTYEITISKKSEFKDIKKSEFKAKEIKKQKKSIKENKKNEFSNDLKIVEDKITKLLESLQLDIHLVSIEEHKHIIFANLDGKDIKFIIGEKGSILNSLEFLLNMTKDLRNVKKVILDANGYREKREASLINLAKSKAEKVLATKTQIKLSPMSSKERRIIHEQISNYPELETFSQGREPRRYLVIKYVGEINE